MSCIFLVFSTGPARSPLLRHTRQYFEDIPLVSPANPTSNNCTPATTPPTSLLHAPRPYPFLIVLRCFQHSHAPTRKKVFSVLLEQMDSFRRPPSLPRVFFLATCPDPTTLDPSLLQRGRLESVLRLGQLDSTGRASILRIHTRGMLLQLLPRPLVVAAGKDSDSSKNALATKGAAPGKDCDVGVAEKNTSDPDIHQAGAVEAPVSSSGSGGGTPSSPCGEENDVGRVSVTAVNRRAAAEAAGSAAVVVSVAVTPSLPPPPPQPQPGTREKFLRLVSAKCHGYLGSDLERLCREAALHHMASFKSAAARTRAASASPPKRLPAQEGFTVATAAAVARGEDPADRERRQEFGLAAGGVREESWSGGEVGEGGVSLQDFWAALDVVRPASLVGHSVGMRAGNGDAEVRDGSALCCTPVGRGRVVRASVCAHGR